MDKLDAKHPLVAFAKKAFPEYRGRKFRKVVSSSSRELHSYWTEGSKDSYRTVDLATGRIAEPITVQPFVRDVAPPFVPSSNVLLVEHTIFCGKDLGCRIYVHPDSQLAQV